MTMKNSSRSKEAQGPLRRLHQPHGIALVRQHGLQRQAQVAVIDDEDRWQGDADLTWSANFIKVLAGNTKEERGAFSKLGFNPYLRCRHRVPHCA